MFRYFYYWKVVKMGRFKKRDDIQEVMATGGNLELRMHNTSLYASTTHDGQKVYRAINAFASFLDVIKNPGPQAIKGLFHLASKRLLPYNHVNSLLLSDENPCKTPMDVCEVVIDVYRKLVLHNANPTHRKLISKGAVRILHANKYEILKFRDYALR